ncbi:MAG TPA: DUF4255 domain-containing protein [Chitinophagaceae bacterium]|jgi:hypothetical protein|nr:DUF4255 domain-containing protein [Chitinophagaceae bacterium]
MIFEALSCVTEQINEHFRNRLKISEEKVVLSGIVNQDGSLAVQGENKLLVTLVNIENDTTARNNKGGNGSGTPANVSSGVNINLYVLFSAYFGSNNYPESLRFLSFIIAYFQNKSVFNRSNTPKMDSRIEKLIFKMENMGIERLNNVWTTLGAKYMPSVLYKMKMLTFDDSIVKEFRPAVTGMSYDHNV